MDDSSLVVDHLSALFAGTPVGVACLYCDYRDMKAQAPANMLGGLLKQLILEIAELEMPKKIIETYQQNKRKNLELSVACEMLVIALQSFRSVYLCIDALDECDSDHRKALLESLRRVMQDSTRLFLTGRPNIEGDVNNFLQTKSPVAVQIIANQHDIEKYVNYCIDEDNNPDIMNDSLREEIVTTISAASQQMYINYERTPA